MLFRSVPFAGKGGKQNKATIRSMLDTAYKDGTTGTPEFQQALSQELMGMLGKGWEGRMGEVEQAVSNATITGQGGVKMPELLKKLRDQGATVGQIATIFEGRHVARYTPTFQAYEQMMALYDKIKSTDGTAIDAVVEGRKGSEAGKTDALSGSIEALMISAERAGGVIDFLKTSITGLTNAAAGAPEPVATTGVLGAIGGSALITGAIGVALARSLGLIGGVSKVAGAVAPAAGSTAGFLAGVTAQGAAAGAAGGGLLATLSAGAQGALKLGMRAAPWLYGGAVLGSGAYSAHNEYQQSGDAWKAAQAGGWGAVNSATFGLIGSPANAGTLPASPGTAVDGASAGVGPSAMIESETMATIERMRASLAGVDFTSEGQRIGESLASGLRAGLASAVAAIDEAGGQMQAAASRIKLNTGTAMGAAR